MRNRALGILTAWTLAILGSALAVLPTFVEPRRHRAPVSHKTAVHPDAAPLGAVSRSTSMSPETLSLSFIHPGQRTLGGAMDTGREAAPATKIGSEPTVADWLRPLGKITDEAGIVRLYFKNARDGRLIRIRQDGTEENGTAFLGEKDDQYLVSIDGERYIAVRRRK